jgi:hypothetical protein
VPGTVRKVRPRCGNVLRPGRSLLDPRMPSSSDPSPSAGCEKVRVRQRRHRFGVLVFSMVLAQAVADVLFWLGSGWPVSRLVYITVASGFLVVIFTGIANASATRASRAYKDGLAYLLILLTSFLCTAAEVIIITVSPFGGQEGSNRFHWTGSTIGFGIAALLIIVAAFIFATAFLSDARAISYFQDIVARRLFRQRTSRGWGALDREPSATVIESAIPREYPNGESREPRLTGSAGAFARGTAWAEGLLTENDSRGRSQEGAPVPVLTEVGFVRLRREDVKLAVINYYPPALLFRALRTMPRKTGFADRVFWVVARPWLPVEQGGDVAGDGHCWVTFGEDPERYGVVTASRAIAEPSPMTGNDVSTRTSRTEISGTVREESGIMKAALIEINRMPRPRLVSAPHTRKAGFGPVRLCIGRDQFNGFVTGLTECSQGGFYAKNPQDKPSAAALVSFTVFSERHVFSGRGDSGSLVLDVKNEKKDGDVAPYLIYLGTNLLGPLQECYGVLLEQLSHHWQINTQFNEAEYNPINAILENEERRFSTGQGRPGPWDSDQRGE